MAVASLNSVQLDKFMTAWEFDHKYLQKDISNVSANHEKASLGQGKLSYVSWSGALSMLFSTQGYDS